MLFVRSLTQSFTHIAAVNAAAEGIYQAAGIRDESSMLNLKTLQQDLLGCTEARYQQNDLKFNAPSQEQIDFVLNVCDFERLVRRYKRTQASYSEFVAHLCQALSEFIHSKLVREQKEKDMDARASDPQGKPTKQEKDDFLNWE